MEHKACLGMVKCSLFRERAYTVLCAGDGPSGFYLQARCHLRRVNTQKFQDPIDGNLRINIIREKGFLELTKVTWRVTCREHESKSWVA
jgi:hypothetical protein